MSKHITNSDLVARLRVLARAYSKFKIKFTADTLNEAAKRVEWSKVKAWSCGGDAKKLAQRAGLWRATVTVNEIGEIVMIDLCGARRLSKQAKPKRKAK
jgi:hypothetical protein